MSELTLPDDGGFAAPAEELDLDPELLRRFEEGLDPATATSIVPSRVLGYGEVSTVLEIGERRGIAYKRMPFFRTRAEAERYRRLYRAYNLLLASRAGIAVPPFGSAVVTGRGAVVVYLAQRKLDPNSVASRLVRRLDHRAAVDLLGRILPEVRKAWDTADDEIRLALDAQLSNWAIPPSGETAAPVYLDTGTPLFRRGGVEQLDPELLLRCTPSSLRWIVRRLFLSELMERYYDLRRVVRDLIANLYKEERGDLVPVFTAEASRFFRAHPCWSGRPLTVEEVRNYYRYDARVWTIFLALRRLDRWLVRARGGTYPFILPGKIRR